MTLHRQITKFASGVGLALSCSVFGCDEAHAQVPAAAPKYAQQPISHYVEQLADGDINARRRAAYILGRIAASPEVAVPALEKALSDGQMETRWYAIDALGQYGPAAAPAVPAIIKSLESTLNDATVRRRGARTLGRIGPAAKAAIPVLEVALETDDQLYRIAAAEALWRIARYDQAVAILTRQANADEPATAFAAVIALGELPDANEATLKPLSNALAHRDADVRHAAVQGLVNISAPAIGALAEIVASQSAEGRSDAARAIGMIVASIRREQLYNDAISESDFATTATPLVRIAFPALASAMNSDDEEFRKASELALAQGGSLAVVQLLRSLTGADAATRGSTASALVRLESYLPKQRPLPPNIARVHQRILDPLIAALQSEDPVVLRAAVRLFVALEIGPEGAAAEPHLRHALETGDLTTRRYADQALQRLRQDLATRQDVPQ